LKKKIIFLGDVNSINIEVIYRSHRHLKDKVEYLLLGNKNDLSLYLGKLSSRIDINEIHDPISFSGFKKNRLNIFNIENISFKKHQNLLNQIKIANKISNFTGFDLVTMPINKSLFKKKLEFNGMTEYLANINKTKTFMLMHGEKFSIIPLTTHINLENVRKIISKNLLAKKLNEIFTQISRDIYKFNFQKVKFLCYNPHCGEDNTLGNEDKIIRNTVSLFKKISGCYSADSAFNDLNYKSLYISTYHDQALIPFKILNKRGINLTLGLNYRRLSPAHGTASDIKFKNKADISSYLACMNH
jgi:4-hydroxythreonine-4-phosphate dehydrogenase